MSSTAPKIYNVTCTLANTEYSQALSSFSSRFMIKAREANDLKVAFISGNSGTTYWTLPGSASDEYIGVFAGVVTVYFQSPSAGTVVEIIEQVQ